ncbi:MAG TPA: hypothetical protein VHZ55_14380 [Bryobacteraceae bacterium]|jgi:hypothetical protein|nr:hypothetical protein [Bryobacteraceae bacterium]
MEPGQSPQQTPEWEQRQRERLASGYYERGKLLETSREFGEVHTANVMLPDGGLGGTERRSRFELREAEENKIEVVLRQRIHYDGGNFEPKELANRFVPKSEGTFAHVEDAQKYVRNSIWDYERVKAEEEYGVVISDRLDRSQQKGMKPVNQLTNQEIVAEARELHSHFKQLSDEYRDSPATQRAHLREEMEPLVDRERALRQEYTGRAAQQLSVDRVPEQHFAFSR